MSEDYQYGFAPGNYTKICYNCHLKFVGAKQAIRCENCAKFMISEIERHEVARIKAIVDAEIERLTKERDEPPARKAFEGGEG